jgi:transposase
MTSRRDLPLEEKVNLIKDKERGLSHRQLSDRFQISVGAVSNILKRKLEYTSDYENNRNKNPFLITSSLYRKYQDRILGNDELFLSRCE